MKGLRGAEPHPLLWWRRNSSSTHHIAYTFVRPADAIQPVTGSGDDWLDHSDHAPTTVDLRL